MTVVLGVVGKVVAIVVQVVTVVAVVVIVLVLPKNVLSSAHSTVFSGFIVLCTYILFSVNHSLSFIIMHKIPTQKLLVDS